MCRCRREIEACVFCYVKASVSGGRPPPKPASCLVRNAFIYRDIRTRQTAAWSNTSDCFRLGKTASWRRILAQISCFRAGKHFASDECIPTSTLRRLAMARSARILPRGSIRQTIREIAWQQLRLTIESSRAFTIPQCFSNHLGWLALQFGPEVRRLHSKRATV